MERMAPATGAGADHRQSQNLTAMKSLRCWTQITACENLWAAFREYEAGKRRRPEVAWFGVFADRHVFDLERALRGGGYHPGAYRVLRIADPKRRIIAAAPVRDRIVHHALYRVIAPWWNRSFSDQSYACLPGRGSHRAILAYLTNSRRFPWRIHLDIGRYFYSIDRSILAELLFRRLPEPPLQQLVQRILDSGRDLYRNPTNIRWLGWDRPMPDGCGLPIGNLTSQWWANVYLDALDHYAQRTMRVGAYLRYMDDIVLFGDCSERLVDQRDELALWLAAHRRLVWKYPAAEPIRSHQPMVYLGYLVDRWGIRPGPLLRQRLREETPRFRNDPAKLADGLSSRAAAWVFGAGTGRIPRAMESARRKT